MLSDSMHELQQQLCAGQLPVHKTVVSWAHASLGDPGSLVMHMRIYLSAEVSNSARLYTSCHSSCYNLLIKVGTSPSSHLRAHGCCDCVRGYSTQMEGGGTIVSMCPMRVSLIQLDPNPSLIAPRLLGEGVLAAMQPRAPPLSALREAAVAA